MAPTGLAMIGFLNPPSGKVVGVHFANDIVAAFEHHPLVSGSLWLACSFGLDSDNRTPAAIRMQLDHKISLWRLFEWRHNGGLSLL